MNSKDFGKRVAALRKEKGLTQSELAEKLNISNKAISRWETGEGYPEITILPSLAVSLIPQTPESALPLKRLKSTVSTLSSM